jgi:glutathione peroxidase
MTKESIYQFKVEDLSERLWFCNSLKGKKLLWLILGFKCGLATQYKDLEAVYKEYKRFAIVGFPATICFARASTIKWGNCYCQMNYGGNPSYMDSICVRDDMLLFTSF